ncbi:MAG: O-antigen ligase family protein [Candidatus Gastranaerophilales bacterium]|nr:O-antigen ligase family protein [Candidatus Gastranaerophilales bacterium]
MQNILAPVFGQVERTRYAYFFITLLLLLSLASVCFIKSLGIVIACLMALGIIVIPFYYNKPHIFLLFSVLIYPFTRYLPLEDKFVMTGLLYVLSMPCAIWVFCKYFRKISNTSAYLWAMIMYMIVISFNIFRPQTEFIDLLKEFGRMFYAIFIILSVYNYVENCPENLRKLSKYISYVMNIIAFIAIGQYITKIGGLNQDGIYRAVGTFTGFNDYAFVLSFFICFSLYFLLTAETTRARFYWTTTIALNIIALVGTVSKTALFNTALIFVIMSMFLSWKRKFQIFASAIVIGGSLFEYLIITGAYNSLIVRFTDTTSFMWRLEMWRTLYNMILQGNIWLGQGANASRNFLQLLVIPGESYAPHNVYLETVYNFGIIGLIPFILMFIFALFQGVFIYLDKGIENNQNKIIGISVIIVTLIAIIQNFVSNAYYDRAGNILFWVILTLLVCWYNYYKSISK